MQASAQATAAEQIAIQITTQLKPNLSGTLGEMGLMQRKWAANGITDQIKAAAGAGKLLAGYDPLKVWAPWGEAFNLLMGFITAPQDALGGATIEQILLTTDTVGEGESL